MPQHAEDCKIIVDTCSRYDYIPGMAKTHAVGVRLDPEVKAALEREAADDQRSLSSLIAKIVADHCLEMGWLAKPKAVRRAGKGKR